MANFMEFIRYGLPGYLFLASILFGLWRRGALPDDATFYNNFGTILGAALIVVGPLVGFIVHQLYFLYFDITESYIKLSRGCLNLIFKSYMAENGEKVNTEDDRRTLRKECYTAWKFLTTGIDEKFKVSSTFLNRLTSLRNYSHSFGGILASSLLSLITYFLLVSGFGSINSWETYWFVGFHLFILVLFGYKRRELLCKINELETGIVVLRSKEFTEFVKNLIGQKKMLNQAPVSASDVNQATVSLTPAASPQPTQLQQTGGPPNQP